MGRQQRGPVDRQVPQMGGVGVRRRLRRQPVCPPGAVQVVEVPRQGMLPLQRRLQQGLQLRMSRVLREPRFQCVVDRMQVAQQAQVVAARQFTAQQGAHHAGAFHDGVQFLGCRAQSPGQWDSHALAFPPGVRPIIATGFRPCA